LLRGTASGVTDACVKLPPGRGGALTGRGGTLTGAGGTLTGAEGAPTGAGFADAGEFGATGAFESGVPGVSGSAAGR
jgi:hypothetical protein